MPGRPRVEVVAAVLQRPDGSFLLAQRPANKVYAGFWEFPGGKVEPNESAPAALARELREELGIEVQCAFPWITRDYDYEHAAVRLRFFRVTAWSGEPHGRENQAFAWQCTDKVTAAPLLPANGPVLNALRLPVVYGISNAAETGGEVFLQHLERALAGGLRLVQLREKAMPDDALARLIPRAIELSRRFDSKMLLNSDVAGRHEGADGVHLTAAHLMQARLRPAGDLVGASCHGMRELAHAAALGVDFVVMGPVLETASHPGAETLGWEAFTKLIENFPLPVYAVGGLSAEHLNLAWAAGAHGIAAIRGAWKV